MSLSTDERPVSDEVQVILSQRDIAFSVEAGPTLRIPHGSAEIVVHFDDLAGGQTIRLQAVVLDAVELDGDRELESLRALNDRNSRLRFGKFFWDRDARSIILEYDLLGEFLQAEELLNAVNQVARTADQHDDLLLGELGTGRRAVDRKRLR